MENFTPISALIGGSLIGLAATLLLLLNGRIAGISGIVGGALKRPTGDTAWRWWFTAGLLITGVAALALSPVQPRTDFPLSMVAIAGFIVGIGTRLGSGCTSGHGVCGMARLSGRSIVATITFLITGMLTVALVTSHIEGF